jgi:hypothetical protein
MVEPTTLLTVRVEPMPVTPGERQAREDAFEEAAGLVIAMNGDPLIAFEIRRLKPSNVEFEEEQRELAAQFR